MALRTSALLAVAALWVAACGDGTGGPGAPTPPVDASVPASAAPSPTASADPTFAEALRNAPTASEDLSAFIDDLDTAVAAVREQDCATVREFNRTRAGLWLLLCTPEAAGFVEQHDIGPSEMFGSGAVIDYTSTESPKGGAYVAALDPSGKWRLITQLRTGRAVVGTPLTDGQEDDDVARRQVEAFRARDCETWFLLTATSRSRKAECRYNLFDDEATIPALLEADPDAAPVRIGGNSYLTVYALSFSEVYATLIASENRGGPTLIWFFPAV